MWRNLVWMGGKGEIGGINSGPIVSHLRSKSLNVQNSVFEPKCISGITLVLNY